ncbi:MAG TPA: hypothetical protein VFK58_01240 [Sphingomicrobium sp.]|nr:hypothetical protein [Sphingomicrobium sp.]
MASVLLRLAMLVALALMPFGMGGAAAIAAEAPAAVQTDCGDHHRPADAPAKAQLHCAGCAALAAIEPPLPVAGIRPELPHVLKTINALTNTEPDTATPPPRIS